MIRRFLITMLLVAAAQASAEALPSPDALRGAAAEQAAVLQQLRDVLRDSDANVRISAFMQLVTDENPVVRQMAYDEAFSSIDLLLRSMALRYSFFDRQEFTVRFPSSSDRPVNVEIRTRDYSTGDFRYVADSHFFNGRVQGLALEMRRTGCSLFFRLNDENILEGEQNCDGAILPVIVDLRG